MAIVLVATLDTKGRELGEVKVVLAGAGLATLVIDAGSQGEPQIPPDIGREAVFEAAGVSYARVLARGDRGEAVQLAARGVTVITQRLFAEGRLDGLLALGGSAGTTIGTSAMRALPFGVPKVMVSTLASGQTRPFLGGSDLILFPSVADIAGLNQLTRTVLHNAAWAIAGMVQGRRASVHADRDSRPVITATMFGVTTPCVTAAQRRLETLGYEVMVFHATGVGGQAMEGLIRDGLAAGILDLTTTEIADEVVGGILSAGPDRMRAGARSGVPQVVSLGALDMVNFGPIESLPERFRGRVLHRHNANVTLMRTTPEENVAIGRFLARALSESVGPTAVLVPRGGVSALDALGQPFFDPEADAALIDALRAGLADRPDITWIERSEHINDPVFACFAADQLNLLLTSTPARGRET
jgi:uncharacterized protein (UPF0261 family)